MASEKNGPPSGWVDTSAPIQDRTGIADRLTLYAANPAPASKSGCSGAHPHPLENRILGETTVCPLGDLSAGDESAVWAEKSFWLPSVTIGYHGLPLGYRRLL